MFHIKYPFQCGTDFNVIALSLTLTRRFDYRPTSAAANKAAAGQIGAFSHLDAFCDECHAKPLQEIKAIDFTLKYFSALYTPDDHMMQCSRGVYSGLAWHGFPLTYLSRGKL
jgi:hypothetical protein